MHIRFAEIANAEMTDACDWYEQQQPGLGLRFKNAVREASNRRARTPFMFPAELEDVRRYVMNRFPYILRYVVRVDEVWIVAVSHQHRHPDHWVERIKVQLKNLNLQTSAPTSFPDISASCRPVPDFTA